jgi:hypothetical protein
MMHGPMNMKKKKKVVSCNLLPFSPLKFPNLMWERCTHSETALFVQFQQEPPGSHLLLR